MTKSSIVLAAFLQLLTHQIFSQQGVGIGTSTPDASAILQVQSTSKGMLVPKMTMAQRNTISSPATGLLIFQTDNTPGFYFYNGSSWTSVNNSNSGWLLNGNSNINPATQFLGTTDNQPLNFKVNNLFAGQLDPVTGNVFLGLNAGANDSTGFNNTAVGSNTLSSNTTGSLNTATGYLSLNANTTANSNTAYGARSLRSNTTGSSNTATGLGALDNNTTGNNNSANGASALFSNTTGSSNTATGLGALDYNTTGNNNTANGALALYSNTTGYSNVAIGDNALFTNNGYFNIGIGENALYSNTSGHDNTAVGTSNFYNNTTGYFNTSVGAFASYVNSAGFENTAMGYKALEHNTTGNFNVAIGSSALNANTTESDNTAVGEKALGYNIGRGNTAVGSSALGSNADGIRNTAVGQNALSNNISGNANIAIGYASGTVPGFSFNNTISIGNNGYQNGASNQAFIGNLSTAWIGGNVTWSTFSDERSKKNVKEDVKGLDFIMHLRPVTYNKSIKQVMDLTGNKESADYPEKYDVEKIRFTGFLAQEVEQAAKTSGFDFSGVKSPKKPTELYTISYEEFVVPLVKAVQEQQATIQKQNKLIEDQGKIISDLQRRMNIIETRN